MSWRWWEPGQAHLSFRNGKNLAGRHSVFFRYDKGLSGSLDEIKPCAAEGESCLVDERVERPNYRI